tara:strand:- start:103 stop:321 length:219 start_codon:yes stop_codon:yes gene_type:complete
MKAFIPYFSFDFVPPRCDVIKDGTVDLKTDQVLDLRNFQFVKPTKCHGINVSLFACVVREKPRGSAGSNKLK